MKVTANVDNNLISMTKDLVVLTNLLNVFARNDPTIMVLL